jgi:hypothetical protein
MGGRDKPGHDEFFWKRFLNEKARASFLNERAFL